MPKKLFLAVSVDWFFLSHRLPIALEAKKRGYEVTVIAVEEGRRGDEIRSHGFRFIPLPTTRSGTNPLRELRVILFLLNLYRKERPDIVHHVAMKPVTYGSIVTRFIKIKKVVNALSGMGFLEINAVSNIWIHRLVWRLFKFSFNNTNIQFILQNQDDMRLIRGLRVLEEQQIHIIKGSGVQLTKFPFSPIPPNSVIKIVLPARMLWDKGVGEYVGAAKILNKKYPNRLEFILCGGVDTGNKAGIDKAQLLDWHQQGQVNWIDFQNDMESVFRQAHIVVLPSYREGLPKALIEACAVGRPIVTTDVPGCREVVTTGENGFLVPAKNEKDLAMAIEKLVLDANLRVEMGRKARQKAEKEFQIENVIQQTFSIYEQ